MRTDPPWSPPRARSASPAATRAALPLDDPPADLDRSHGLRTGPVLDVWLPPEKHRSSQTALPVMVAPASSRRGTTVASRRGVDPSPPARSLILGTPASSLLAFS